jgi:RHS repeat-associated protein
MTYPNNFGVNYIYDNNGYTTGMTRTDNNEQIWNFGAENRFGQLTAYTLGNNIQMELQYDAVSGLPTRIDNGQNWGMSYDFDVHTGNLNSRAHLYNGLSEDFEYDNLDRLTNYNTATKPLAVTYANTGSITFKGDAGRYTNHQPTGRTTSVDHESSASGFEISDVTQSITYTAFNSVESIMEDAYDAFFTYGPDQQRSKMLINHQGSTYIERMYMAGGQYERDRLPDGSWRNLTYISTPAGLSAVFIQNEDTQEEEFYFIHTDYQGSIMALTDYNGQLVEEYSYDPWGNRRDPNTWQTIYTNTTLPSFGGAGGGLAGGGLLYRGYTFHEHLDCFALINMNGRMYDPVLGRMLSPDNYTHSGTQGLNRYAYVFNNPLKYTDPSGEFPWLAVMIGVAINTSLQARSGNMNTMLAFGTAIGVGAAAGATGYYTGAYIAGQVGSFGFVPGAIVGATGGGSGGFITGAGNAWSNGSSLGQGLRAGLQSAASGYMFGALIGGSVGLLRAIGFGLRPIDGVLEIPEADLEYYQYLASVEPGATGITDPGQISWQSSSKADKLRHFLKWIRYANTVEKSGEIRWSSMFDDIDPTTVIVEGGGPSGFDIREFVNVDMSGKVIPTKLSIWGNKPSGRQVHDIIDLPGPHTGKVNGSSLYYAKSSSYRFVTNNWSNLEYALEWLGFWN